MRQIQITIFVIGLISFIAALFFIGQEMGDTLWRIGVAGMVTDIALMKLFPPKQRKG